MAENLRPPRPERRGMPQSQRLSAILRTFDAVTAVAPNRAPRPQTAPAGDGRPPSGLLAPITPWPADTAERIAADLAARRARNAEREQPGA